VSADALTPAESALIDHSSHALAAIGRSIACRPARHGIHCLHDVAYGPHPAHRLDAWIPPGPGPHPVAVYAHGGAFRVLSRHTHWMMALSLARLGFVVYNIDYRLAPAHPYPAAVEDVLRAWRWVHAHAASHGGDLSRTVMAGESAGANLSAAVTLATCWQRPEPFAAETFAATPPPRRVLAAYGFFQASETRRYWQDTRHPWPFRRRIKSAGADYLGAASTQHRPGWGDLADPVTYLERQPPPARPLPPFFLPVGGRDPLQADSARMQQALSDLGAEAVVSVYPGQPHGFTALWWTAASRAFWHDAAAFLAPLR